MTIIGYQFSEVTGIERALYGIASVFLTVPELFLLPAEGVVGLVASVSLTGFAVTFPVRIVGLAMLAGLSVLNRRRADKSESRPAGTPAADA